MADFEIETMDRAAACDQPGNRLRESACFAQLDFDKLKDTQLTPDQRQARQAIGAALEFFHGSRAGHELLSIDSNPNATAADLQKQQQFFSHVDRIVPRVPAGSTVDASQFNAVLGQDADAARAAGLVSISRDHSNHIVLNFQNAETYTTQDGSLYRAKTVEFDFSQRGQVSEFANIRGLQASSGLTVDVDDLKFTHLPNGNTRLEAEGHWGFFHATKTLVFDRNGEQVPGAAP